VHFDVGRGEIFALVGPNGAGKTTTVEMLEGYRKPDAGSVRVLGLDPVADGRALRPRIGVMLQEGGLYPGLRPLEVLRLFAAFYDNPRPPEELLDLVGLGDTRRTVVRRLSGGQKQRLSLACALVGRPELVFLDEPTAGMDPQARATTWDLVRELRAGGTTIVLTTHLLDEAEQLCDRVAIVVAGRVAALGTPRELMSSRRVQRVTFTASAPVDARKLAHALDLDEDAVATTGREGEYEVRAAGTPALVAALAQHLCTLDVSIGSLQANEQSLEAVFLQITAETSA
jgi:ABC-2 type transport system ATP-binding protein